MKQRTPASCGLAALVLYQVDATARKIDPKMHGLDGMYSREMVAAARLLGFELKVTRQFDLDKDEGVLRIHWTDRQRKRRSPGGHFVAVIAGSIHCPDLQVALPWRDYLATYGAMAVTLLKGSL